MEEIIFTSRVSKKTFYFYLILGVLTLPFYIGVIFIYIAIRYNNGKIELTEKRFNFYQGIFIKKHTTFAYTDIESVQTLSNTIRITLKGGKKIQIVGYDNIEKIKEIITKKTN